MWNTKKFELKVLVDLLISQHVIKPDRFFFRTELNETMEIVWNIKIQKLQKNLIDKIEFYNNNNNKIQKLDYTNVGNRLKGFTFANYRPRGGIINDHG